MPELEQRFLTATQIELRLADDDDDERDAQDGDPAPIPAAKRIVGTIPFNSLSEKLTDRGGQFREKIMPTAFAESMADGSDIRSYFNHDEDKPLGRRSNGSIRLRMKDTGLAVSITPPDTTWGRDALEAVRSGLMDGFSFSFRLRDNGQEYTQENGERVRLLRSVELLSVDPVYDPAYRCNAEIDARSKEAATWQPSLAFQERKQKLAEAL